MLKPGHMMGSCRIIHARGEGGLEQIGSTENEEQELDLGSFW